MRLSDLTNDTGTYCLLDLEQLPTDVTAFGLDSQSPQDIAKIQSVYKSIMQVLSPEVSGVVLSPEYTFDTLDLQAKNTGLVLGLDSPVESLDPLGMPPLWNRWSVEHCRNNYAVAKLRLYYDPYEPQTLHKKQLVAELYDFAHSSGIDFVLELAVFDYTEHQSVPNNDNAPDEQLEQVETVLQEKKPPLMSEIILRSVQELRSSCDALILEPPPDALTSVTITAELDIPWLVRPKIGTNTSYADFKEVVRAALESGAAGFLAGSVFWQSAYDIDPQVFDLSEQDRISLFEKEARDQVLELARIVAEAPAQPAKDTQE